MKGQEAGSKLFSVGVRVCCVQYDMSNVGSCICKLATRFEFGSSRNIQTSKINPFHPLSFARNDADVSPLICISWNPTKFHGRYQLIEHAVEGPSLDVVINGNFFPLTFRVFVKPRQSLGDAL